MTGEHPPIVYLSQPTPVNMTDAWYEIASLDHFWVLRRFEVFRKLAGPLIRGASQIAEIGCGSGLVQRWLEDQYGATVAGFDLNEPGLKKNVSRRSQLYYYDIHDRRTEFNKRFDLLIMFDVLEHIADESGFLDSARYHLHDSGAMAVNVPAVQCLYSDYDRAAGHVRRYTIRRLREAAERSGLRIRSYAYWGAPLLPLVVLRKVLSNPRHGADRIYASGVDPGSPFVNRLLGFLARCEPIPQRILGTSLMAVLEKQRAR